MIKQYIPVLRKTRLFKGLEGNEISAMLGCLQARLCSYGKGEYVLRQGEPMDNIAVAVDGKLHIQKDDYWGKCSIVNMISVGEMFGEAYLSPEGSVALNDVISVEDSRVIFFDAAKVITVCSSACRFHSMIIKNLFFAISEKNRKLVQKLGYMSKRSTREKLISYLSDEAERQGGSAFTIPFNRQQLADFLSVDRSAMSAELCRMRDQGLLCFNKNRFTLFQKE